MWLKFLTKLQEFKKRHHRFIKDEKLIKEYYIKLLTTNLKSGKEEFPNKIIKEDPGKLQWINYHRRDCQKIKDLPLKTVPGTDGFITNFYLTIFKKFSTFLDEKIWYNKSVNFPKIIV